MCKQFMLGVCRPLQDGGSYPLVFAIVDALQRGHWSPNDFFFGGGSLHHCSISVAVSHGDAAGQDALNHAAVEVAEDLRWHTKLSHPAQKVQLLPILANWGLVVNV